MCFIVHQCKYKMFKASFSRSRSRSYFTTDSQSVSQSVSMSWYRASLWDLRPDIISCLNVLSEMCGLLSMGCPLWREDGSAIWGVITQWSESLKTRNHTLLSHLRLPQPGGPGSRIYIPQEQGGPVTPPGTGFPLRRLLRLAELRSKVKSQSHVITNGQSISMSWCLVHSTIKGFHLKIFNSTSGGVY
jgi:hypothetical protein